MCIVTVGMQSKFGFSACKMVHVRNCQTTLLSKHFHVALQGKPMVFLFEYTVYFVYIRIYSVLSLYTSLRHFFCLDFYVLEGTTRQVCY